MKTSIIHTACLAITTVFLFSCGNRWHNDSTDNIQLTDFTKDLISLYLQDSIVLSCIQRNDEITLICSSDEEHYYLSLYQNESEITAVRRYFTKA